MGEKKGSIPISILLKSALLKNISSFMPRDMAPETWRPGPTWGPNYSPSWRENRPVPGLSILRHKLIALISRHWLSMSARCQHPASVFVVDGLAVYLLQQLIVIHASDSDIHIGINRPSITSAPTITKATLKESC